MRFNTSNKGKFEEFQRLFAEQGMALEATHLDLKEIAADPVEVVAHKASQLGEKVVVEDTSLEVEGAGVGIHVKYLLDHLPKYAGRKAVWTVLLAYRDGEEVYIYRGEVKGTIVEPRGAGGFGFDPVFLPEGATLTLAESKPNSYNARAKAVEALVKGDLWLKRGAIEKWDGPWQE